MRDFFEAANIPEKSRLPRANVGRNALKGRVFRGAQQATR
jgi:hypothetical protein